MASFVIHQADDEPWESTEQFGLPGGTCHIYKDGSEDGIRGILGRVPPGYVEPEHVHEDSDHWSVVIDGEMHVAGRILRAGDYIYAPRGVKHGPFHYPVGCTVFTSVRGSFKHEFAEPAGVPSGDVD